MYTFKEEGRAERYMSCILVKIMIFMDGLIDSLERLIAGIRQQVLSV